MKDTIEICWGVNVSSGVEHIPFEDLGVECEEEWDTLSADERQNRAQLALDELPARVCVIADVI